MGTRSIKLGATLSFDDVKERDIIEKLDFLLDKHKLGEFISHLIRIALESPEKYQSQEALNLAMADLMANGMDMDRLEQFKIYNEQINEMKRKIDLVYDVAFKNYTMTLMGKTLGMTEKTENSLKAQFVIQRQLSELTRELGESLIEPFESSRLLDTKKRADEVLESIIESYDGIVQELKEVRVIKTEEVEENIKEIKEVKKETHRLGLELEADEEDEVIEFTEDVSALTNFFGG